VAGEAAGYGLGLLFVGTASEKTFEMLAYAHDTQHEKIIRGVSMGLALIMYGRHVAPAASCHLPSGHEKVECRAFSAPACFFGATAGASRAL
jgi:hypothetical protein